MNLYSCQLKVFKSDGEHFLEILHVVGSPIFSMLLNMFLNFPRNSKEPLDVRNFARRLSEFHHILPGCPLISLLFYDPPLLDLPEEAQEY